MKSFFNRKLKIWIWLPIIVGILIVCLVAVILLSPRTSAPTVEGLSFDINQSQIDSVSSNVLFLGNTYWGRYINDWSMASPLKYAYPFSRLSEFDRENYDAWISGLECPTVAGLNISSKQEDATLSFNCSPDYLPEAAKWFTAFTLANNHTDNQGEDGFIETKKQLDKNGIQYFGHYDPYVLDDNCEVISLPVTIKSKNLSIKKGSLPVAMCGFHGVFKIPPAEAIGKITEYSKYMPVIAMPHMGAEYEKLPDTLKENVYRSMIDAGADMVIGDHPHTIQTTEAYKGKLLVYSMGNFIFDQQGFMELTRSAGIKVIMDVKDSDKSLIEKWLALGELCSGFKDDCLDQARLKNLTKLDIEYKFGIIGTDNDGKIVKPATEAQQNSILERLKWTETVNNLLYPYSGL